jgi:hypothetical protein
VQVEVAFKRPQFHQQANQVLHGAAEPIDGPRCNHVDLARRGVLKQAIKCRPLIAPLSAADAGILIDLDDLPAAAGCHGLELLALVEGRLAARADPEIDPDPLYDSCSAMHWSRSKIIPPIRKSTVSGMDQSGKMRG